ncbi:hypothetical protein M427DRAFT_31075 [Gonapodya prolifera JEL478]|uniref:Uncharacterized protein n=1 Tax=Gonapodya prolifera (strain JEL478) TaxID=1344416 RepID=A0A139AIN7_GONPJ|nr:hypothetical protein M427DRAFT_31075 [Gonapodya prolifera JEL478]|eukprot:KXS16672.1 hypothetical protein M427DRAFT_31075 [Gonapodya prolifera JEL478]
MDMEDGDGQLPPLDPFATMSPTGGDLTAVDDGWGDVLVDVKPPNGWMIAHVFISLIAFTVIIPLGVALARRSHRGHIILQSVGVFLVFFTTVTARKGDKTWRTWAQALGWEFTDLSQDVHNQFGWLVFALVMVQGPILGVVRSQVLESDRIALRNIFADPNRYGAIKGVVTRLHNTIGYFVLPIGYAAIAAGFVSMTGTCGLDGLGGCASHLIFGSILLWYSAFAILAQLQSPSSTLRRRRSVEFYDSLAITMFAIIAIIGFVVWGAPSPATALLLVSGGMLGCMLEMSEILRWRNPVPGMIMVAVGLSVLSKAGYDPFAVKNDDYLAVAETYFGWAMTLAGVFRILATAIRPLPPPPTATTTAYAPLATTETRFSSSDSTLPVGNLTSNPLQAPAPPKRSERSDAIPVFLHNFFLFTSGVLYIGSSASGVPPKWAAAANLDAVQLSNGLISISFFGVAWLVLIGSLAAAAVGSTGSKSTEEGTVEVLHDQEFDHEDEEEPEPSRHSGAGKVADGGEMGDVEMEAFLGQE